MQLIKKPYFGLQIKYYAKNTTSYKQRIYIGHLLEQRSRPIGS